MQLYYLVFLPTLLLAVDGLPKWREKRLAGGKRWPIEMAPYMVSLEHQGETVCGASIISRDLILTAGHCTNTEFFPSLVEIRAGSTYPKLEGYSLHYVVSYARHENFTRHPKRDNAWLNDVAVVKVSPVFVFGVKYQPVRLFDFHDNIKSIWMGVVTGWGAVPAKEQETGWSRKDLDYNQLQMALVTIIGGAACREKLMVAFHETLEPGQFCSSTNVNRPCHGDDGGPIVVKGRQAGIISSTSRCNDEDRRMTIYTEVAYFRSWIDMQALGLSDFDWDDSVWESYTGFKRILLPYR